MHHLTVMALVTIRILDGPERGRSYRDIATPVTIGREEGNYIQLNDERVSRYHLKIHENSGAILLTDLQSTNGTRVNGEAIQVWHLRPGDLVSVGRSLLIFGSSDEIANRLKSLKQEDLSDAVPMGANGEEFHFFDKAFDVPDNAADRSASLFEMEIFRGLNPEELAPLHLLAPPDPPDGLTPRQLAQMTEYLQYILLRLRYLVTTVHMQQTESEDDPETSRVTLDASQWQNLLDFYDRIARQLHSISEP